MLLENARLLRVKRLLLLVAWAAKLLLLQVGFLLSRVVTRVLGALLTTTLDGQLCVIDYINRRLRARFLGELRRWRLKTSSSES